MKEQQLNATQYVEGGGSQCLFCLGANITANGGVQSEAGQLTQKIECLDCGGEWTDTYELSGIYVKEEEEIP